MDTEKMNDKELAEKLDTERDKHVEDVNTALVMIKNQKKRIADLEAFIMLLHRTDHQSIKGHYRYELTLTHENEKNVVWEALTND